MEFRFVTALVTKATRPGWAQTTAQFVIESARLGGRDVVQPGFELDWDSVPRIPPLHAWLKGRAEKAACYHDWLYRYQEFRAHASRLVNPGWAVEPYALTRRQADLAFLDAMVAEGVARRHRWPIYIGVRLGGWIGWHKHRRALKSTNAGSRSVG